MKNTSVEDRCSRCGGVFPSSSSGTITQWIATCHCNDIVAEDDVVAEHLMICAICNKRINGGRAGSFTQWVFRHDQCKCENPQPIKQRPDEAGLVAVGDASLTEFEASEDAEHDIEVPSDRFPLDRYRPKSVIGKGSSGTVYRCLDKLLNKMVAVKTLRWLDSTQLVAFQHEAKATSKLNHQYIVQVLDFGTTTSGAPFMAMEYIDGVSMEEYLSRHGPLPIFEAVDIISKVCDGLSYAHKCGVFHRDIKSSNLLLKQTDGQLADVRLIDFGVATAKFAQQESTAGIEAMVGSPLYMPPDQARGEKYDERSEVYGLGCTLFEALTGRPPFEGSTALDTIRQHAQDLPARLSDLRTGVEFPDELESIVARCLSKKREERYQSMSELGIDLKALLEEQPPHDAREDVAPAQSHHQIKEWKRAGKPLLYTGSVMATLTAITISIWLGTTIIKGLPQVAEEQKSPVEKEQEELKVTRITQVIDEALGGHFQERKLASGKISLNARGSVSDETVKQIRGRKDVGAVGLIGDDITDVGLTYLDGMPLTEINLYGTRITDTGLRTLNKFPNLMEVNITNTKITNDGLKYLITFPALTNLAVGGHSLTDSSLSVLAQSKGIKRLELHEAERVTASGIKILAGMAPLSELAFRSKTLNPELISAIGTCRQIESLTITGSTLTDRDLHQIGRLSLKALSLYACQTSPWLIGSLGPMKGLNSMTLSTPLADADLANLKGYGSLKELVLITQTITDEGLKHLESSKTLKTLKLAGASKLSDPGVNRLRKRLRHCRIDWSEQGLVPEDQVLVEMTDTVLKDPKKWRAGQ